MFAGKATVSFFNRETNNRYSFKIVRQKDKGDKFWVYWMGQYLGFFPRVEGPFISFLGKKNSPISKRSLKAQEVFEWIYPRIIDGTLPEKISSHHNNLCGKCGRPLTDALSLSIGLGPTCRGEK